MAHNTRLCIVSTIVQLVVSDQCFQRQCSTFKNWKSLLKFSKFVIGRPCWNKWKIATNYTYFFFFYVLSPFTTCTTTISHSLEACSFSFFTWALEGQRKYCLRITHCLALLHFRTLEYLMRESSFGINNFSFPLMSKHICILPFSFSRLVHILV
jgi:hypothetical protein